MRFFTFILLTGFLSYVSPALAQETAPPAQSPAPAAAPQAPPQDPATLDQRLALAKKMHDLRPAKDQVEMAIEQVAASRPPAEQESFKQTMRSILNFKAIEKISIDAMADTYTVAELQAMVDYYSKPEATSAGKKDEIYAQKVYPEIVRMLDQAIMRTRTGGDAAIPGGAAPSPQ